MSVYCRSLNIYQTASTNNSVINKKAQLLLTNPHDAKACKKLLQFDVKTSCGQVTDLFEVIEISYSN